MNELIYFSVQNLFSFGDEVEFSLEATSDAYLKNNLINISDKLNLSPILAFYGANASGKTNIIKALSTLKMLVTQSGNKAAGIDFLLFPFKLLKDEPTVFKIIFISNNIKYSYLLELNKERVLKEYLYDSPNGRQSKIFEREFNQETQEYEFNYSKSLSSRFSTLEEICLSNKLFLSTLAMWMENVPQINNPFSFFDNSLEINSNDENPEWLFKAAKILETDTKIKDIFLKIFKEINNGIKDILVKIKTEKLDIDSLPSNLPIELKIALSKGDNKSIECKIKYSNGMILDYSEESRGIQKLLILLTNIIESLLSGKVLIIDELETALHPIIAEHLISLFLDKEINKNGSQLIFSTHDVNLLDAELLRKDQIWFFERTPELQFMSRLYSLANITGIRKDENIRKNYIKGKYGSVPCLNEISMDGFINFKKC